MKRFTKYLALFLTGSLAALTACGPEMNEVDVQNNPAINSTTLSPMTDESGSTRAYVGTEISVGGFNLDRVSHVTVDGLEAEITEKTIKILKFKIPALDLAQQDAPYQVWMDVYDADGESVIFHYPYYVTIPVTDALITAYAPAEGTVGTVVTLTGRNLEQITRVHFGAVTVEASAFTEVTAEALKFAVPAGEYEAGDSQVAITAEWGTATIDVTGETLFTLHTPKFDAASQEEGTQNSIGDEVTFTGQNLDLVSGMKWGDYDLIVVSAEAEAVTVRFPSSIAQTDPVVAEAVLTALWGEPAQTTPVASAWRVDTTPVGPAAPVLVKMEAEDGGDDNKFYLGKTVTVTGENLASIEGFKVDGVEAALVGEPTDISAQFIVPDGVTFTEAKEVPVVALYNGGNEVDFGTAMVYPFYYYKDLSIGCGSSSSSNFTVEASENAFLIPDEGVVISADKWLNDRYDPYALEETNPVVASNVLDKTKITSEEYYAVKPYLVVSADSKGKMAWQSTSSSDSQLKCQRTSDKKSVSSTFGTPITAYKVLKDGDVFEAIKNGSLTSMALCDDSTGSSAPAFGTGRDWLVGDVLVVRYASYTFGNKPTAYENAYKQGFIVIKEVTCADPDLAGSDGKIGAVTDFTGHVTFDLYWSKPLNE